MGDGGATGAGGRAVRGSVAGSAADGSAAEPRVPRRAARAAFSGQRTAYSFRRRAPSAERPPWRTHCATTGRPQATGPVHQCPLRRRRVGVTILIARLWLALGPRSLVLGPGSLGEPVARGPSAVSWELGAGSCEPGWCECEPVSFERQTRTRTSIRGSCGVARRPAPGPAAPVSRRRAQGMQGRARVLPAPCLLFVLRPSCCKRSGLGARCADALPASGQRPAASHSM